MGQKRQQKRGKIGEVRDCINKKRKRVSGKTVGGRKREREGERERDREGERERERRETDCSYIERNTREKQNEKRISSSA